MEELIKNLLKRGSVDLKGKKKPNLGGDSACWFDMRQ